MRKKGRINRYSQIQSNIEYETTLKQPHQNFIPILSINSSTGELNSTGVSLPDQLDEP